MEKSNKPRIDSEIRREKEGGGRGDDREREIGALAKCCVWVIQSKLSPTIFILRSYICSPDQDNALVFIFFFFPHKYEHQKPFFFFFKLDQG